MDSGMTGSNNINRCRLEISDACFIPCAVMLTSEEAGKPRRGVLRESRHCRRALSLSEPLVDIRTTVLSLGKCPSLRVFIKFCIPHKIDINGVISEGIADSRCYGESRLMGEIETVSGKDVESDSVGESARYA
jgi:hypothetical protein